MRTAGLQDSLVDALSARCRFGDLDVLLAVLAETLDVVCLGLSVSLHAKERADRESP
jgi:hypothetical protein